MHIDKTGNCCFQAQKGEACNLERTVPSTSSDPLIQSDTQCSSKLKRGPALPSEDHKPLASISLDLDNQWSYMKTHGDPGWEKFPSYFDIFIPYVLDVLDRLNLSITFFIVGQDAELDKNHEMLAALTEKGHEVGNHSFNHEPWIHLYSRPRLEKEILKAEEHITKITGQRPIGFRGPGFVWSSTLLEVLADNEYLYDASILPTYLGPLARAYYFWKSDLTEREKKQRKKIFGSLRDGMRPTKPYYFVLESGANILEIPVTTIPILKTPFHLSYLLYLSRISQPLMSLYLKIALFMCRITKTEPSFLLHPLDLISGEQIPELAFFPGMHMSQSQKIELFENVLQELSIHFTLVNMSTHAHSILRRNNLKTRCVDQGETERSERNEPNNSYRLET